MDPQQKLDAEEGASIEMQLDPLCGTVVGERFRIDTVIGRGAMGAVYRARDQARGRDVAFKVMLRTLVGRDRMLKRFLREAKVAMRVHHPNVVRVDDAGTLPDGKPYLVMELLEGDSLAAELDARRWLDRDAIRSILDALLQGLEAAHALGIVHRDIKPANVFITREGVVKLIDFGLAKFATGSGGVSEDGQVIGTPDYLAPEQLIGGMVDGRADLWALAVVLDEVVAGERPFEDRRLAGLFKKIATDAHRPVRTYRRDAPMALDEVLRIAMAKRPDERYQTAQEFAEALHWALDQWTAPPAGNVTIAPPESASGDAEAPDTLVDPPSFGEPA